MSDWVRELIEFVDLNYTTCLTMSYLTLTNNKLENSEPPCFLMAYLFGSQETFHCVH